MTAADMTEHCLDDELLAAFVDDRLSNEERAQVLQHLATCGDCRSALNDISDITAMLENEENVTEFRPKSRGLWAAAAAAAAVIAFVILIRPGSVFDEPGIPKLVKASAEMKERKTYGRLSGGFDYKPINVMRGQEGVSTPTIDPDEYPLAEAAGEIQNGKDLHARGVLALLLGDRNGAVTTLEKALANNPADRDVVEQDLAVALLQRAQKDDVAQSLQISERLWAKRKSPETAWNRAYALDLLGQDKEAIAAWDDYLALDTSSAWATEARTRRDLLQSFLKP